MYGDSGWKKIRQQYTNLKLLAICSPNFVQGKRPSKGKILFHKCFFLQNVIFSLLHNNGAKYFSGYVIHISIEGLRF